MSKNGYLYVQIKDYLKSLIEHSQNDPLYLLPSENQLAQKFRCSRISAKRALNDLEAEGLIIRRKGRGSFVQSEDFASHNLKKTACLLAPELSRRFMMDIIAGIQEYFSGHDINLYLSVTENVVSTEEQAVDSALRRQFDGLLIFPVIHDHYNKALLNMMLINYPVVFVGRQIPGLNTSAVHCNHYEQMRDVMDFLFERGHSNIGFLTEKADIAYCYEERIFAYKEAAATKGKRCINICELDFFSDSKTDAAQEYIRSQISQFFQEHRDITALVSSNHACAYIDQCAIEHRAWIEKMTLVIFDLPEKPILARAREMFFVNQHPCRLGYAAARQLHDQIVNHAPPRQVILHADIEAYKSEEEALFSNMA